MVRGGADDAVLTPLTMPDDMNRCSGRYLKQIVKKPAHSLLPFALLVPLAMSCGDWASSAPSETTVRRSDRRSQASSIPDATSHFWSVVSGPSNGAGAVNIVVRCGILSQRG